MTVNTSCIQTTAVQYLVHAICRCVLVRRAENNVAARICFYVNLLCNAVCTEETGKEAYTTACVRVPIYVCV